MPKYPQTPGHNKVDTSIQAANSMIGTAATMRSMIYRLLSRVDSDEHLHDCSAPVREHVEKVQLTSREIATKLSKKCNQIVKHDSVWKRISELRANGRVEDSGIRRTNPSGRKAKVWKVRTEEGIDPNYLAERTGRGRSKQELQEEIFRLNDRISDLNNTINKIVGHGDNSFSFTVT